MGKLANFAVLVDVPLSPVTGDSQSRTTDGAENFSKQALKLTFGRTSSISLDTKSPPPSRFCSSIRALLAYQLYLQWYNCNDIHVMY